MTAAEPNYINVGCSHEAFLDPSQIWRVFTDASHELCAAWKRCIVCFQIISKQQNGHKGPACFKGWQRSLCTWSNQAQNSLSRAQTETALSLSLSYMQLHHQAPKAKARQASCEETDHHPEEHAHTLQAKTHTKWKKQMDSFWMEILYLRVFFYYCAIDRLCTQTTPSFN